MILEYLKSFQSFEKFQTYIFTLFKFILNGLYKISKTFMSGNFLGYHSTIREKKCKCLMNECYLIRYIYMYSERLYSP